MELLALHPNFWIARVTTSKRDAKCIPFHYFIFANSKTDQMGWIFRFLQPTAYVDTPRGKNRKRRPFQRFLQELGDLNGVSCCAFSDLIAAAPDLQTIFIGEILADAANEHEILIGGIEGHGINLIAKIIY